MCRHYQGEGPPDEEGYIEPPVPREQVRQEPYPLPNDFVWSTIDFEDDEQVCRTMIFAYQTDL